MIVVVGVFEWDVDDTGGEMEDVDVSEDLEDGLRGWCMVELDGGEGVGLSKGHLSSLSEKRGVNWGWEDEDCELE